MNEAFELLIRGIRVDWNEVPSQSYLRRINALKQLNELSFEKPVTCFCGENGSGKSTLLEAMAVAYGFNPEGGTINYAFSTYDSHSGFFQAVGLIKGARKARWGYFLRAESFYNVATMDGEYAKGPGGIDHHYHEKSHGESFLALVRDHFTENGLYFLDEPESALSPQRQLTLLIEISRCAKDGAQFFIATHSPILLGIPNAQILCFDQGTIHPIAYEETDSYRVTSMFVNSRERFLNHLLSRD